MNTITLTQIDNLTQILRLRASGNADLIPGEFAKYSDRQLVEMLLRLAAGLLDQVGGAA